MQKKHILNTLKYCLLGIFLGFFISITFFKHVHIVNGISIVHSHPFKADTNGKPVHSHTSGGYLLINLMMNFVVTAFTFGSWVFFRNYLFTVIISFKRFVKPDRYTQILTLRGPPSYSLI